MTLRLLEHYVSTQGEGPNVGKLTQFVRFAGCNLKCPLWPCDTPYAIEPKIYRQEQQPYTWQALASKIHHELKNTGARNVCFTGGEPTLQPQEDLTKMVLHLDEVLFANIDFEIFSNATLPLVPEMSDLMSYVIDWKLPGSGEDSLSHPEFLKNLKYLDISGNSIKFTIATMADLVYAREVWRDHLMDTTFQIFVGPAWNKMSAICIVEYIKEHKLPWRLNIQVHNYIYGAQKRGI